MKLNLAYCLLLLATLQGCQTATQRAVQDAPLPAVHLVDALQGPIDLPYPPSRVAALTPGLAEMMVALGAGERLVARAAGTVLLDTLNEVPQIALGPEPELQKLLDQKPEVVLLTDEEFGPGFRALMAREKVAAVFVQQRTVQQAIEATAFLGQLLGLPARAKVVQDSLQQAVDSLKADAALRQQQQGIQGMPILVVLGEDGYYSASDRAYLGDAIKQAGGENVLGGDTLRYPALTQAVVAGLQPAVLLVVSEDPEYLARFVEAYPSLAGTPAIKSGRYFQFSGNLALSPGMQTPVLLRALLEIMYPKPRE